MTSSRIRKTVLDVLRGLAPETADAEIEPETPFIEQFDLDSMDFLRLMEGLERALGIAIRDLDYPRLSTLRGCEEYLSMKVAAA